MTPDRTADRTVVAAAVAAGVLAPLNSTMIVVALPTMLAELGASLTWGSWIVISYLVAMAAVQPLGGSLGDRYGRRRMMMLGLGGFTVATIVAAFAPSIEVLVVARTLQAITGASAIPNGTAFVRLQLPVARQGRALGLIGAGIGLAAALGPPLGGVVTDALGWRWIFAVNLLVLVPGLVWAGRLPRHAAAKAGGRFDLLGAILVLATLVALTLAGTLWRVPGMPWWGVAALAGLAVGAGAWLRRHVARTPAPVLDLTLFGRPGFLAAGVSILCSNLAMYTILLAIPVFLTQLVQWSPRDVGLLLAGMSVPMMVFGPVGGALSDRFGRRAPALLGTSLAALGALPLVGVASSWAWPTYLAALVVVGAGIGLASAPVHAAALEAAQSGAVGQAAGLFSTMRYLGSILGTAGMAAVLGTAPEVGAFRWLFGALVAAALGAALASSRLPRPAPAG